jgi:uncharacterized membrane protein YciS (DUF1049 family)
MLVTVLMAGGFVAAWVIMMVVVAAHDRRLGKMERRLLVLEQRGAQ